MKNPLGTSNERFIPDEFSKNDITINDFYTQIFNLEFNICQDYKILPDISDNISLIQSQKMDEFSYKILEDIKDQFI